MPLGAKQSPAHQDVTPGVGGTIPRTARGPSDKQSDGTTPIERVCINGAEVALIIRAGRFPDATQFVTPTDWSLQAGFVVYPAGGEVAAHRHKPIERRIRDTGEVLVVRQGRCAVDFYDERGRRVDDRALSVGDVLVLRAGGHGLRMFEDTVLLEIKQGPYAGPDEKEYL